MNVSSSGTRFRKLILYSTKAPFVDIIYPCPLDCETYSSFFHSALEKIIHLFEEWEDGMVRYLLNSSSLAINPHYLIRQRETAYLPNIYEVV